jgi:hypothetical protein
MGQTLLRRLLSERRLTRPEALAVLKRRAIDLGLAREYTLSLREFDRYLSGEFKGRAHPLRVRVLEAEFGYSIRDLLRIDDGRALPIAAGITVPAAIVDVARLVRTSATESSEFGQWADSLAIGDLALTTLWLRVEQVATGYVHSPMVPVFHELLALRDDLFRLLREPDPRQTSDLYLVAGIVCGMLAHASGNLGDLQSAHIQALTALTCARKADHPTLAAWILGVRALQCEWSGRPDETLVLTAKAHAELIREQKSSTVGIWIHAIEARACARLARPADAAHAIRNATERREQLPSIIDNDLDRLGGILSFPHAKQLYYAGSAYRRVGKLDDAALSSTEAIEAYVSGPAAHRSYGDEAIARIDLAIAHVGPDRPDVEAAASDMESLLSMPSCLCLPTMSGPLRDLDTALAAPKLRTDDVALGLREAIRDVLSACEDSTRMIST